MGVAVFDLFLDEVMVVPFGRYLGQVGNTEHLVFTPQLTQVLSDHRGRCAAHARINLVKYHGGGSGKVKGGDSNRERDPG